MISPSPLSFPSLAPSLNLPLAFLPLPEPKLLADSWAQTVALFRTCLLCSQSLANFTSLSLKSHISIDLPFLPSYHRSVLTCGPLKCLSGMMLPVSPLPRLKRVTLPLTSLYSTDNTLLTGGQSVSLPSSLLLKQKTLVTLYLLCQQRCPHLYSSHCSHSHLMDLLRFQYYRSVLFTKHFGASRRRS